MPAAQAGDWPVSWGSLLVLSGFACQLVTLCLGTGDPRGLLGEVLGPSGMFPLDLSAACAQA